MKTNSPFIFVTIKSMSLKLTSTLNVFRGNQTSYMDGKHHINMILCLAASTFSYNHVFHLLMPNHVVCIKVHQDLPLSQLCRYTTGSWPFFGSFSFIWFWITAWLFLSMWFGMGNVHSPLHWKISIILEWMMTFSPYNFVKSTRNERLLQRLRNGLSERSPVVQKKINKVNTF